MLDVRGTLKCATQLRDAADDLSTLLAQAHAAPPPPGHEFWERIAAAAHDVMVAAALVAEDAREAAGFEILPD